MHAQDDDREPMTYFRLRAILMASRLEVCRVNSVLSESSELSWSKLAVRSLSTMDAPGCVTVMRGRSDDGYTRLCAARMADLVAHSRRIEAAR